MSQVQIRGLRVRLASLLKSLSDRERLTVGLEHGLLSAVAAVIAYLPPELLGLAQSFWGAITAVAVVQTEYDTT